MGAGDRQYDEEFGGGRSFRRLQPISDRVDLFRLRFSRISRGLRLGGVGVMRPLARRMPLSLAALAAILGLGAIPGPAGAYSVQYCSQIPIVGGIPPWGFHTGSPITGSSGSYARGHGDISLTASTISGILCQVDRVPNHPDRLIIMAVERHLLYHSHSAVLWGFPGNLIKFIVRVQSSSDPRCTVGTLGYVTLFGSYNGVRSDSVRFSFPAGCRDHNHLYHGPQVNNQVPPA